MQKDNITQVLQWFENMATNSLRAFSLTGWVQVLPSRPWATPDLPCLSMWSREEVME